MTERDDIQPRQQRPFEHLLYGLPSEVRDISDAPEPHKGRFRTGRRKLGAGILVAALLSGGAGAAYAVHERNTQAEAEARSRAALEVSRLDEEKAAELEAARTELETALDRAREVHADSADNLAADEDARAALRLAIAKAERIVDDRAVDTEPADITDAEAALREATDDVVAVMDREARATLTGALDVASEVLAQSEGNVADEQVRIDLGEGIEEARAVLESDGVAPRALAQQAAGLAEFTQYVKTAVEALERERESARKQPVMPPAPSELPIRGNGGTAAGSSDVPSPPGPPSPGTSTPPVTPRPELTTPEPEPTTPEPEPPTQAPPPTSPLPSDEGDGARPPSSDESSGTESG